MPKESLLVPVTDEICANRYRDPLFSGIGLLFFHADWCQPCLDLAKVLETFAKANPDIRVLSYDVDRQSKLKESLEIKGIPTLMLFEDGQGRVRVIGHHSFMSIERLVNRQRAEIAARTAAK